MTGQEPFVVGLSWKTAPVSSRERFAFTDSELPQTLSALTGLDGVSEVVLVSTCNRVEVYGATGAESRSSVAQAAAAVRAYLGRAKQADSETLAKLVYEHTGVDAARHGFRVASALDSMVLGEAQILGQMKSAYGVAVERGVVGPVLTRCFEHAFRCAKRVRTDTGIARGGANISSVAVELAKRVFVDLAGRSVALVGAGKMSALAAQHLRANGAGAILVTNRSRARAEALAHQVDGVARPWEQLDRVLATADVVITSTAAPEPILTKSLCKRVMKTRRYASLVVIDIAVPRDVDPAISKIDGVYLFDVDDLEKVVAGNLRERAKEAESAEDIVAQEVARFSEWLSSQRVVPTIKSLRSRFQAIADSEVEKLLVSLDNMQDEDERRQAVKRLVQSILNKLLHAPMTALRQGDGRDIEALVQAAQRLFDLEDSSVHALSSLRGGASDGDAATRTQVSTARSADDNDEQKKRGSG